MKEIEPKQSSQKNHHELRFLKNDLLGGFLNKDTLNLVRQARSSFKKGEKRIFSQDIKKIAENLVDYEIRGLDNLPNPDGLPLIVVMNHPDVKDFLEAAFLVSWFSPKEIHWFLGANIPRRDLREKKMVGPILEKTLFKGIDSILKSIIETYDFIGVPTKDMEKAMAKRTAALRKGIKLLQKNAWVGILPEAEFEKNNQIEPFHKGIGLMVKKVKKENLRILPIKVWREKMGRLHIVIGQNYKPDYEQKVEKITQKAEEVLKAL
jgi:1-acyl-sn-glycerol-3-phosphate acyltransferase